jgi:hypothetical protein
LSEIYRHVISFAEHRSGKPEFAAYLRKRAEDRA